MWNIHEDVTEDMFPSFVDKETMTYLTEVDITLIIELK